MYPAIPTGVVGGSTGIPATETETSGSALSTFQVVAFDTNGDVVPAISTTALNRWNVVGISQQTVGAASAVEIAEVSGLTQQMLFSAAPAAGANGSIVFLSTVAGEVTLTPPVSSGNTIFRVGILVGADGLTTTPAVQFRPQFVSSIP